MKLHIALLLFWYPIILNVPFNNLTWSSIAVLRGGDTIGDGGAGVMQAYLSMHFPPGGPP